MLPACTRFPETASPVELRDKATPACSTLLPESDRERHAPLPADLPGAQRGGRAGWVCSCVLVCVC